jgi:polyhydroxyalkanoate synthesis repressor PhaR
MDRDMADTKPGEAQPITIKKYANRRLYNTATSSYVTLDDLCQMVKQGQDFAVFDAKTGEDITRSVLAQIIFEEEGKSGQNMLPIRFLRQLIRFYGDSLQAFVPNYLEVAIESFTRNQEQLRKQASEAFGGFKNFGSLEEMGRQNMAMFQRAMTMFVPFGAAGEGRSNGDKPAASPTPDRSSEDQIKMLRSQLDAVQRQLDQMSRKS